MLRRLYLLGAAGAGVSTLGRKLSEALAVPMIDVDDYYWLPTDPPFQSKRPIEARIDLLRSATAAPGWVLAGSLDGWGDVIADQATHVIYVDTDAATRLSRLRGREHAKFGARIGAGGDMEHQHEAFLAWAAAYDDGSRPGRSKPRHEAWLANRTVPVVRLNGSHPADVLAAEVLSATAA